MTIHRDGEVQAVGNVEVMLEMVVQREVKKGRPDGSELSLDDLRRGTIAEAIALRLLATGAE